MLAVLPVDKTEGGFTANDPIDFCDGILCRLGVRQQSASYSRCKNRLMTHMNLCFYLLLCLGLFPAEANMILEHENELLHWPGGLPTVSSLDEARVENEIEKKLHPHPS